MGHAQGIDMEGGAAGAMGCTSSTKMNSGGVEVSTGRAPNVHTEGGMGHTLEL